VFYGDASPHLMLKLLN